MATKWKNGMLDLSDSPRRMRREDGAQAFFTKAEAAAAGKPFGFSARDCVQAVTRLDRFWVIRDPAVERILCNDGQMRPQFDAPPDALTPPA